MKLVKFYSDGELSSLRMASEEETVLEVRNLFFDEQLIEEQIMLEIYSQNRGLFSEVDELRLDFDRIYTRKDLYKKAALSACKFVDSSHHTEDFSMATILSIKSEQRYLNATFKNFMILKPRITFFGKAAEPMLFASLKNDNYYLLNHEQSKQNSAIKSLVSWIRKKISF